MNSSMSEHKGAEASQELESDYQFESPASKKYKTSHLPKIEKNVTGNLVTIKFPKEEKSTNTMSIITSCIKRLGSDLPTFPTVTIPKTYSLSTSVKYIKPYLEANKDKLSTDNCFIMICNDPSTIILEVQMYMQLQRFGLVSNKCFILTNSKESSEAISTICSNFVVTEDINIFRVKLLQNVATFHYNNLIILNCTGSTKISCLEHISMPEGTTITSLCIGEKNVMVS